MTTVVVPVTGVVLDEEVTTVCKFSVGVVYAAVVFEDVDVSTLVSGTTVVVPVKGVVVVVFMATV